MAEPPRPEKLSRKFKEFSFDEDVPASGDAAPSPAPAADDKPVRLTREDMDFIPYGKTRNAPANKPADVFDDEGLSPEEEEMREEQEAWQEEQEATFDAAGSFFRHNRKVNGLLEALDNLEMDCVITAGILDETYRGRLPEDRVNNLMLAALSMNANNYGELRARLPSETVGIVDDLQVMFNDVHASDRKHLEYAGNLGPGAKRVLLANTVAQMEMVALEMKHMGDVHGPDPDAHDQVADMIKALSQGVDASLVQRAVKTFNSIAGKIEHDTRLVNGPGGVSIDDGRTPPPPLPGRKQPGPPRF